MTDIGPPSYREATRERLLTSATAILEAEGLEAVQARRVAREAGCSVGTLYNVFGDIDGLIIAMNARSLARLGQVVSAAEAADPSRPLADRLLALAKGYVGFAVANRSRWEAIFKHRLPDGREVPASYLADQARLMALIEEALAGTVSDPERRAFAARGLFAAVHGAVTLALDDRLGGQLHRELEAQIRFITGTMAAAIESGRDVWHA